MAEHISVVVVGATGYGGAEIIRLLADHPRLRVTAATSARLAGEPLRKECPWLATDLILSAFDPAAVDAEFVVLAQENGFAMANIEALLPRTRVVDLSADFRLRDYDAYRDYYGREHTATHVEGTYGLPELFDREAIAASRLIANPGCYPTAALLALTPLAEFITGVPVIDSKSGVSGAGRSRKETDYLFSELDGGFKAYGVTKHRHTPEIEQGLGRTVRFTPHLVPMPRGIHSTAHIPVSLTTKAEVQEIFRAKYADERFVQIVDAPPSTKQVRGSNRCDIYVDFDPRTQMAVVISVIDNLVKGMAGQAIQNLNLMAGLPEEMGLPVNAVWP